MGQPNLGQNWDNWVFVKLPFQVDIKHILLFQVMVTEGPGGEETMVYDITLSEIQSSMDH